MRRNVKLVFFTNALILLFSVVTSLLSAWALKPEGRGDLAIVTIWIFVFSLVGTLGLPVAHRYWSARRAEWQSEIFTNTIVFALIAGLALVLAAWFIVPWLTTGRSSDIIWFTRLFSLNIPVVVLTELLRGQLEGARLFGWVGAARLSFITTQAVGYSVFYFFGWLDLESALWIIVVGQIICPLIMVVAVVNKLKPRWKFDLKIFRQELGYGLRGYFGIITGYAVLRLDLLLLAFLASNAVIGLYAVAVSLAEITATLASSVADTLMPEVAAANDPKASALLLGRSLRLMLYAHLIVLVPFWVASPYILQGIYGESFLAATNALRLLLLASIIWSAALAVVSALDGFGHPGLSTVARITSGVTTVAALLILMPRWGIIGVALASLIGYGTLFVVAVMCFVRQENIRLWQFLRPRSDDISFEKVRSLIGLHTLRRAGNEI
jgi:O-antigen/teichoic acid export membrane protein